MWRWGMDAGHEDWWHKGTVRMLWFNFILGLILFPFFGGMEMYDNQFQTKWNKILTKHKIEPQHVPFHVYRSLG